MRSRLLVLVAGLIGCAIGAPAQASTHWGGAMGVSGVCPNLSGNSQYWGSGGGASSATDCNLIITFNSDGSISTAGGPNSNYDGTEDALIGVVNNSGHAITSFTVTGAGASPNIFAFESDGIDTYIYASESAASTANPADVYESTSTFTGYGGPMAYFTGVNGGQTSGTVNFAGGLASGSNTFFSLEQQINIDTGPLTISTDTPEPATIAVLGVGLAGLITSRRRRRS